MPKTYLHCFPISLKIETRQKAGCMRSNETPYDTVLSKHVYAQDFVSTEDVSLSSAGSQSHVQS